MNDYHRRLTAWRERYRERLLAERGWLRAAGLAWLDSGANRLVVDPETGVTIAPGADGAAGSIERSGDRVRLRAPADTPFRSGDGSTETASFTLERDGDAPPLRLGRWTLVVVRRGGRIGVRLYDPEAPGRRTFAGLDWFPIDPAWRIEARFEPYPEPRPASFATIDGEVRDAAVPGEAAFTLADREVRLQPIPSGERLLFVFRDGTSGVDTYPACRFLSTPPPRGGALTLDFNRATNPPCAYTPHATCPLPLPGNRLVAPIRAGERRYLGEVAGADGL